MPPITSFWDAALPPLGHEDGVLRLRALIEQTQQPQRCSNTCVILRKSLAVNDSMQNIRKVAHLLLQATLGGCALVSHRSLPMNDTLITGKELHSACSQSNRYGLRCYFLPLSNCTTSSRSSLCSNCAETDFPQGLLEEDFDLSQGLDQVANSTGLRSEVLVMGTLLSWVMRPQPELRAAIEHYGSELGLNDPSARYRHVAMHVRHRNAFSEYAHNARDDSWRIAPETHATWAQRLAADIGARHIIVMNDDPAVDFESMVDAGNVFRSAPTARECTTTRAALATRCGPSLFVDDGIQLFAGVMLLAQCAAFVGTQRSNIGSAAVELMATQRHPPVFKDVLNDVHRAFLSDERVWYGGVHISSTSARPLDIERLVLGGGRGVKPGVWASISDQDEEHGDGRYGRA